MQVRALFRPAYALWLLAGALGARQDPAIAALPADLTPRIHRAIDRGVDALLRDQQLDGSWRANQPGFVAGSTGLAVQTLLKCGVAPEHPSLVRAMEYLRAVQPVKTYEVATNLIAYTMMGQEQDHGRIEELTATLIDTQDGSGGWAYPDAAVDLSNTQYALLALRTAAQSGLVRIPKDVWIDAAEYAVGNRSAKAETPARTGVPSAAGFGYQPSRNPTGSMTAAALTVLVICEEQLGKLSREAATSRAMGLAWLAQHFAVEFNPNPVEKVIGVWHGEDSHLHYYLYGVERVAGLLGLERIGEHDWYGRGAAYFVGKQEGSGLWQSNMPNTCFALLFLRRATASATTGSRAGSGDRAWGFDDTTAEVSLRAAGLSPTAVWLSSFGTKLRSEIEWDGEAGAGPRVVQVAYFVTPEDAAAGPARLLGTIAGDPDRPAGKRRFALQHHFVRPGRWKIHAEVTVLLPDGRLDEEFSTELLVSKPIEVPIPYSSEAVLLEYARDPARNLLAGRKLVVQASSRFDDGWRPEFATENCRARGWLSAADDVAPWITLDIGRRGIKANRLLLSHPEHQPPHLSARVHLIEVRLNGAKEGVLVEMDPDRWRKTAVDLGKTRTLRKIELRVREIAGGSSDRLAVGLGEIELQLRS